ncbi:hypothetical protein CPB86DRAFT_362285 [Serendipita vermifera]|nr:hypothetical protein CPB86DRAFT_362285 [Serendipita vermifera]
MEDGATGLGTTFKISSTTFLLFPSLLLRIPAWVPAIGVTGSCTVFSSALLNKCLFTIILICEIAFITRVGAATYTIDNMDILIRYTGPWIPSSECSDNCVASPEPSRTYAGTWHVATWGNASRSIEYTSKGTEIAFYGILVYGSSRETPWNINISLTVDEERM